MAEKVKLKRLKIRLSEETHRRVVELAERRGRSINVTLVDLIEGGFDWLRSRFQISK